MTRRLPGDPPVLVGKTLQQTQEEQQRFNEEVLQLGLGSPPDHADTHDVESFDPLSGGGTPITVLVGESASAGSGPGYMREDAQLVVAAGSPAALGAAAADGSATSAARSDHVHKRAVEIRVDSVSIATRRMLNLIAGAGIILGGVDDAGGDEVEVTITATAGILYYQTIQEEGSDLTQRAKLNFIGAGVAASDDAGNDRSNITIPGTPISLVVRPAQITASQNDYAPGTATVLFLNSDADWSITGLVAATLDGWVLTIWNNGAFILTLITEDLASVAANRFSGQGGADVTINPGFSATLTYDSTAARWRAREE